jgi:hypothetical protein
MGRIQRIGVASASPFPTQLSGSTAARPTLTAGQAGITYYNTDVNQMEVWSGTYWHVLEGYPNVTVSTSQTAGSNHTYWVNTSGGAVTLTLPLTPRTGDRIGIYDIAGTFGTNNLTIGNNGHRIQRQLDTMTVSTNGAAFALRYYDVTRGWLIENI